MAVIDTRKVTGLGQVTLKFSKRFQRFEIELPDVGSNTAINHSLKLFYDYRQYEPNLKLLALQVLAEESFTKQIIVIKFQSSESDEPVSDKRNGSDTEKLHRGLGFVIEWYIVDEFKIGTSFRYKVTECSKNSQPNTNTPMNIYPQLFNFGRYRKLEYSEGLHTFLLDLENKIGMLCTELVTFFDEDPEVFLGNIQSNIKLLR